MNERINQESVKNIEEEKQQAIFYIRNVMQQCASMGANDSEMPDLIRLQDEVISGETSPEEARKKAQGILDNKQDYH